MNHKPKTPDGRVRWPQAISEESIERRLEILEELRGFYLNRQSVAVLLLRWCGLIGSGCVCDLCSAEVAALYRPLRRSADRLTESDAASLRLFLDIDRERFRVAAALRRPS